MFRWLLGIGLGLIALAVVGLVTGLTSQQPVGFALSIMCAFPLAMFFLGGATFNFAANYSITPKSSPEIKAVTNGRTRLARTPQELG